MELHDTVLKEKVTDNIQGIFCYSCSCINW